MLLFWRVVPECAAASRRPEVNGGKFTGLARATEVAVLDRRLEGTIGKSSQPSISTYQAPSAAVHLLFFVALQNWPLIYLDWSCFEGVCEVRLARLNANASSSPLFPQGDSKLNLDQLHRI